MNNLQGIYGKAQCMYVALCRVVLSSGSAALAKRIWGGPRVWPLPQPTIDSHGVNTRVRAVSARRGSAPGKEASSYNACSLGPPGHRFYGSSRFAHALSSTDVGKRPVVPTGASNWRQRLAVANARGVAKVIKARAPFCTGDHYPLQPHHFGHLQAVAPPLQPRKHYPVHTCLPGCAQRPSACRCTRPGVAPPLSSYKPQHGSSGRSRE